jgi:hypothetical protein
MNPAYSEKKHIGLYQFWVVMANYLKPTVSILGSIYLKKKKWFHV